MISVKKISIMCLVFLAYLCMNMQTGFAADVVINNSDENYYNSKDLSFR